MEFKYNGEYNMPIDLRTTIESGQTFLWNKTNGNMFEDDINNPIYSTVRNINDEIMVLKIQNNNDNTLKWKSTHQQAEKYIYNVFQFDKNIREIQDTLIKKDDTEIIKKSINEFPNLRIIHEPLFPTLISFICSTQMRVERIHEMVQSLSKEFGKSIEIDAEKYYSFPTVNELSNATKKDLDKLKLGYRSKYVIETTKMIKDNPLELSSEVSKARKQLQEYMGVGPKVADCVLLYGAGFQSVVPVDVWIERAAKEYYPELSDKSRNKIARNLENKYGDYAGFAQAYLFHYMRMKNQF